MAEKVISFFNCCEASRKDQISVTPVAAEETALTVKVSAQTAYTYIEKAAHRLSRWITIAAKQIRHIVTGRVRAFIRNIHRMTGVQILHQYATLRI